VSSIASDGIVIDTEQEIEAGDGIVFVDHLSKEEIGSTVFGIRSDKRGACVSFSRSFSLGKVREGMHAYVNANDGCRRIYRRTARCYGDRHRWQHRDRAL
jgi:hypothetical protein